MPFQIIETDEPRWVRLVGELDLYSVPIANGVLERKCAVGSDLFLELSQLDFIDSSGVQSLITAFLSLKSKGARLVLQSPTEPIRRVLDLLGLTANGVVVQEAATPTG